MARYNLGQIWLQVVPSFDKVQAAARAQGAKDALAYKQGWDSVERGGGPAAQTAEAQRRGKAEGDAEGRAKERALSASQRRERTQRAGHHEQTEAQARKHQDDLDKIEARARAKRETNEAAHQGRMAAAQKVGEERRESQKELHGQKMAQQAAKARAAEQAIHTAADRREEAAREAHARKVEAQLAREVRAERRAAAQRAAARQISRQAGTLGRRFDTDPAQMHSMMQAQLAAAAAAMPDIKIGVDTSEAEREAYALRRRLQSLLRDVRIGTELESREAVAEFVALRAELEALAAKDVHVDVDLRGVGAAAAQMAMLTTQSAHLDRQNRKTAASTTSMGLAGAGAANAMRLTSLSLLGMVALGPILIPTLLGIAGAVAAIGMSAMGAVTGIGVLALGLSGVGGALQQMQRVREEEQFPRPSAASSRAPRPSAASSRAPRQVRDNTRQVRQRTRAVDRARRGVDRAQRGVGDAEIRAAEHLESTARNLERAERDLERAQVNARRTQEGLTRARREARREIEDMANSVRSGALAEQDALYDLEEARYSLHRIMQDGSATQRERDRAQLAYDIQEQQYNELILQNERLRADESEVAAAGVEGSDRVVSAKESIEDANRRVEDAELRLRDASRDSATAQADAARMVADAQERLQDAQESLADAQESLADAQRNLNDLYNTGADELGDIGRAAQQAAQNMGPLLTAANNLERELAKLSPAGREFVQFLDDSRWMMRDFRWAAQEALLPGIQAGLEALMGAYYEPLLDLITRGGELLGGAFQRWAEWASEPAQVEWFETMSEYALTFMDQWFEIFGNLGIGFGGVMEALAPFAEAFNEAMIGMSESFAAWAQSPEGQEAMANFFQYLQDISPKVLELFTLAFEVLANLFIGLAPYTELLIDFLIGILEWVAGLDPDTLARFVGVVMALVLAVQLLAAPTAAIAGIMRLVDTVMMLWFLGPMILPALKVIGIIALVVAALVGLGLAIKWLWDNTEWFQSFVYAIRDAFVWLWESVLSPIISAIGTAFVWLWENVIQPIFGFFVGVINVLATVFTWLWENVISPIIDVWIVVFGIWWAAIQIIFKSFQIAIAALGAVFTWLWEEAIRPAWNWISGHIRDGWNNYIKPILDTFANFIEDHVRPKFEAAVEALGRAWNWLREMFAKPIVWFVDTIINDAIIGNFNKVADFFGVSGVREVSVPQSMRNAAAGRFAGGGILSGYSPGRDDQTFYSPTHGALHLSGGEGIAVPELVRAIGADNFMALNRAARAGGISGARDAMSHSYAGGGILDWIGNAASTVAGWAGDFWDWITKPATVLKDIVSGAFEDFSTDNFAGRLIRGIPTKMIDTISGAISSMFGRTSKGVAGNVDAGGLGRASSGNAGAPLNLPGVVGHWQRPSFGPVTSHYGPRALMGYGFHYGTDVGGGGPVYAAGPGRIRYSGPSPTPWNTGSQLWIDHPGGALTTYGHMPYASMAPAGTEVRAGTRIGRQGAVGKVTGTHLHFEYHPNGWRSPVDPRRLGVFDSGGTLPPGYSTVLNATGKPEQVFNSEQMELLGLYTRGEGGTTYDIDINQPGATAGEIVSELNFELRRQRRGGVYA